MNSLKNEKAKKEYEQYVNEITPKHNLPLQMGKAFVVDAALDCVCWARQFSISARTCFP